MKAVSAAPFLQDRIVGFSIAESEELLALGFGVEHQREMLLAIARATLRAGADLCYGGHLHAQGSFTIDLIDLISAEQRESASPAGRGRMQLGHLFNPLPWPFYETLTVADEARWIDCCTSIRVRPEDAGLARTPDDDVTEPAPSEPPATPEAQEAEEARKGREQLRTDRRAVHRAAVVSRMRRMQVEGFQVPAGQRRERSIDAAILLGGKVAEATGCGPGLLEEGMLALQARIPVFVLGGFGGAAGVLAEALTAGPRKAGGIVDRAFERFEQGGNFATLTRGLTHTALPAGILAPEKLRATVRSQVVTAAGDLGEHLRNGLSPAENRELFRSTIPLDATRLVLAGLRRVFR